MMWGPGLGLKMAKRIQHTEMTELPVSEITLECVSAPTQFHNAIALPFPTK